MKKFNISSEYDIELFSGTIYDSKNELTAQICAFLNPVRQKLSEKLNVKSETKLSSSYVLYYYYIELSFKILDFTKKTKNEKSAIELIDKYFSKLFTFEDFKEIVSKYGLVPISVMPDAACHHKSDPVYVLENRLRLGVRQITQNTKDVNSVIVDIVNILNDGLGAPKENFSFAFINKEDELETLENLTPVGFFNNYCNTVLEDYILIDASGEGAKETVANQIKGGEQVVVCADTRHQQNQMLGILDTDFIEESDLYGGDYSLSKAEKLDLKIIKPTAYLSLDGVAFDENKKPLRFKAQDAHGSETGADGHYTMSADWFDKYVLSAVINKKYL